MLCVTCKSHVLSSRVYCHKSHLKKTKRKIKWLKYRLSSALPYRSWSLMFSSPSFSFLFCLAFLLPLSWTSPLEGGDIGQLSIMNVYLDEVLTQGDKMKIREVQRHPDDPDFEYTLGGVAEDLVLITGLEWTEESVKGIKIQVAEVEKSVGCFQDERERIWVVAMMNRGADVRQASYELLKLFDEPDMKVKVAEILFNGPQTDFSEGWSAEVKRIEAFERDETWEYAEVSDYMVFVRFTEWTENDIDEIRERFEEVEESMGCFVDGEGSIWVAAQISIAESDTVEEAAFSIVKMFDTTSDDEMDTDSNGSFMETD